MPLRMARMLESPFAFYRGTAGLMALDLADDPHSGLKVICCGDAHISNFGFYASPERRLVFDLNDFDEAAAAPWEWDLKRLVTSAIIGGRHAGYDEANIESTAREAVLSYTFTLDKLSKLSPVDRYFMHSGGPYSRQKLDKAAQQALDEAVKAAERRTARAGDQAHHRARARRQAPIHREPADHDAHRARDRRVARGPRRALPLDRRRRHRTRASASTSRSTSCSASSAWEASARGASCT